MATSLCSLYPRKLLAFPEPVRSHSVSKSVHSRFPNSIELSSLQHTKELRHVRPPRNARAGISCRAIATTDFETVAQGSEQVKEIFACPICHKRLIRNGPTGLSKTSLTRSRFECPACKKVYSFQDEYLDLTILKNVKTYRENLPTGIELFRNPLVSFVYERGWRQNFASYGFPGLEEEFRLAQKILKPAHGGILVDASCGSGLFSRKFAQSDSYSTVIALDFSENMLKQASTFIQQDSTLSGKNIALVRADIARLPFEDESIDAVHAGAALHCWPSPSLGVAEICRVLKPGGIFVATTILYPRSPIADELFKPIRQTLMQGNGLRFWEIDELEELCNLCGLSDYEKDVRSSFIMLNARKPNR